MKINKEMVTCSDCVNHLVDDHTWRHDCIIYPQMMPPRHGPVPYLQFVGCVYGERKISTEKLED
jgi:hypothetical protein